MTNKIKIMEKEKKPYQLKEAVLQLIHVWIENDIKATTKKLYLKSIQKKQNEKFLICDLITNKTLTYDTFSNIPDKDEYYWIINLRFSCTCFLVIFLKFINYLKKNGFDCFMDQNIYYDFEDFLVYGFNYRSAECTTVQYPMFGIQNERIQFGKDTKSFYGNHLVFKVKDKILDISFGQFGYSNVENHFVFLDWDEYQNCFPGKIMNFEKEENLDQNLEMEFKRNNKVIQKCVSNFGKNLRYCSFCALDGDKICSGCSNVRYCSSVCQKKDWKIHKKFCKK